MARIVGAYATGHAPNMVTTLELAGEEVVKRTLDAYAEIARRIRAAGATTLLTISNDHFNNLFLNNLPAFLIGVAPEWTGPEDDLKQSLTRLRGNAPMAAHIVRHMYQHEDFEPAVSHHLKLDHGTYVPVRFTIPEFDLPLIPVLQNTVQPPLPRLERSAAFGAALRRAIESFPGDDRVAVIGAGGMSHFIGVPGQGDINLEFDQRWIALFQNGDLEGLKRLRPEEVAAAGNGAEEIRNWITAMACADGRPAEWLMYAPVPAWLIGMGVVDFHYATGANGA